MLAEWMREWLRRHERVLERERTLIPVRAARQTFFVTAKEAEDALSRAHDELYLAFERRPDWGRGKLGQPCPLAVRGLATRRLADRLRDVLRARNGRGHDVDLAFDSCLGADPRLSVSPIE